ncbi:MAG: hypothetical protein ABIH48_01845 [Candidatus Falkowbacteria bacterium]
MDRLKRIDDLSISNKNPKNIYFVLAKTSSVLYRKNAQTCRIQKYTGYGWVVDDQIRQDLEVVIIEDLPMTGAQRSIDFS